MAKAVAVAGERPEQQNTQPKGPNQMTAFVDRSSGFLKDVRNEMRKVVTPSREEVQTTTGVVIFTVFAFAAFFYVADNIFGHLVQLLLKWLGSAQ